MRVLYIVIPAVARDEGQHQCCVEWVRYRHTVSEWVNKAGRNDQSLGSIFHPDWHLAIQFVVTVTYPAFFDGAGMPSSATVKFHFIIWTSNNACWFEIPFLITSLPPVSASQAYVDSACVLRLWMAYRNRLSKNLEMRVFLKLNRDLVWLCDWVDSRLVDVCWC